MDSSVYWSGLLQQRWEVIKREEQEALEQGLAASADGGGLRVTTGRQGRGDSYGDAADGERVSQLLTVHGTQSVPDGVCQHCNTENRHGDTGTYKHTCCSHSTPQHYPYKV